MFFFGFFPQKTGLEWHPRESPHLTPDLLGAGDLPGCSWDSPTPTPQGTLALIPLGSGEMLSADSVGAMVGGRGGGH